MERENIAPKSSDTVERARNEREKLSNDLYGGYFPRAFDFYGLGTVALSSRRASPSECADSRFIVTFQVSGDELGLCAVAFEQPPQGDDEQSQFTELANILASKFVTQLADANCTDIMISAPLIVALGEQKHRFLTSTFLAANSDDAYVRRYDYQGTRKQVMRLVFLPTKQGGRT